MGDYSPLALRPPPQVPVPPRSAHRKGAGMQMIDYPTNTRYNDAYMGLRPIEELPHYGRVLVVGAGPTLTLPVMAEALTHEYDAVLVTFPMARVLEPYIDREGWYIMDAERDPWLVPYYYGDMAERVRLICRVDKYLQREWTFKEAYAYRCHEPQGVWPRTSGAVGLKVALDVMKADRVDVVGVDMSGHFEMFRAETEPYIERARATRVQP